MTPIIPPSRGNQSDSVKLIRCYAPGADEAFKVYSALCRIAVDDSELGNLPMMQAMRGHAYDTFLAAFECHDYSVGRGE